MISLLLRLTVHEGRVALYSLVFPAHQPAPVCAQVPHVVVIVFSISATGVRWSREQGWRLSAQGVLFGVGSSMAVWCGTLLGWCRGTNHRTIKGSYDVLVSPHACSITQRLCQTRQPHTMQPAARHAAPSLTPPRLEKYLAAPPPVTEIL